MPHFVVDCSKSVFSTHDGDTITKKVHLAAISTGLFSEANVQIRITPFDHYLKGNEKQEFIHVFASILEGRTPEQKLALSKAVVTELADIFPDIPHIGVDIRDIQKGTGFSNKGL